MGEGKAPSPYPLMPCSTKPAVQSETLTLWSILRLVEGELCCADLSTEYGL